MKRRESGTTCLARGHSPHQAAPPGQSYTTSYQLLLRYYGQPPAAEPPRTLPLPLASRSTLLLLLTTSRRPENGCPSRLSSDCPATVPRAPEFSHLSPSLLFLAPSTRPRSLQLITFCGFLISTAPAACDKLPLSSSCCCLVSCDLQAAEQRGAGAERGFSNRSTDGLSFLTIRVQTQSIVSSWFIQLFKLNNII